MFWGNSSKSRKIFTLQKKIIRIMGGAQAKNSYRSLFKLHEILPVPCQYILSFMNSIKKTLKQIHLYTILIQEISIIFIDQMTTYLVFKKAHSLLASKFPTVYHLVRQSSRITRQNLKQPLENTYTHNL
jgi:hypothetical protein